MEIKCQYQNNKFNEYDEYDEYVNKRSINSIKKYLQIVFKIFKVWIANHCKTMQNHSWKIMKNQTKDHSGTLPYSNHILSKVWHWWHWEHDGTLVQDGIRMEWGWKLYGTCKWPYMKFIWTCLNLVWMIWMYFKLQPNTSIISTAPHAPLTALHLEDLTKVISKGGQVK